MKILKRIGLVLLIIIVIACIYAAFLPSDFTVERSTIVNSDEASVWNGINKLNNFKKWNPWLKYDTTAHTEVKGDDGAVGAVFSWDSQNKDVGAGEMTITAVEPMVHSDYDLHFIKPFDDHSKVSMKMEKSEGGYKVTWSMSGDQGFMMRLMMIPMGGMDGAIGKDFEAGLKNLKELCESGAFKVAEAPQMPVYTIADIDFPKTTYAAIRSKVAFSDMPKYFETSFGKIMAGGTKAGLKVTGPPSGIYYMYDEKGMMADLAAAVPMDKEAKIDGVSWVTIEAKKAHQIDYYGDYKNMMPAYNSMSEYLKANNLGPNPEMVIEQYISDPMTEKDTAKWRTNIIFFTK